MSLFCNGLPWNAPMSPELVNKIAINLLFPIPASFSWSDCMLHLPPKGGKMCFPELPVCPSVSNLRPLVCFSLE